jgi:hypothetical protein
VFEVSVGEKGDKNVTGDCEIGFIMAVKMTMFFWVVMPCGHTGIYKFSTETLVPIYESSVTTQNIVTGDC